MERSGTPPSSPWMRLRVGFAITGVVLGLPVFIVFLAVSDFRNYHVAVWGGLSAVFAMVTLVLHLQHSDGNKSRWIPRLSLIMIIGFVTQMCCIVSFFTYIIMAAEQGQDLSGFNCRQCGYYLAAIWVFMTWKWSLASFIYARAYRNLYTVRYVAVVDESND